MLTKIPNDTADRIRSGGALPELLCPAGSYEAFLAAIEGGADAIYVGGSSFNARANAKNLTRDEMSRGIALAHTYGIKVYVAANTLIYDLELDAFLREAEFAHMCGADALIVADIGAAQEIRRRLPIDLHASTQMSVHNVCAANLLAKAGFSRVVCAREMSRDNIDTLVRNAYAEIEVFVHGALCVCTSGQCLFSSLVGGRSGNRGECAQPCRLPFKTDRGRSDYLLSLKDLCLARHIPALCELGVASLKIEGRMKSPEYVRDVTRIFRRLLDERRAAEPREISELEAIFSRSGFTDAYFTGATKKNMLGVRSDEQKKNSRALLPFDKLTRKIPVDISISLLKDTPARLTLTRCDTNACATCEGDVPFAAINTPIDSQRLSKSICKLGDTPFSARNVSVELDEGLMIPISSINALRRKTVEALIEKNTPSSRPEARKVPVPTREKKTPLSRRTAIFYDPVAVTALAKEYFDLIFLPLDRYDGSVKGVMLPPVIFDSELQAATDMLMRAVQNGARYALVGNLGHVDLAKQAGLVPVGDFRLNVCNCASASVLEEIGLDGYILSPEATLAQARDIGGTVSMIVFGRVPLMVTEKCVATEISSCDECRKGTITLTDRRGVRFPVLREWQHRSLILNSVPIYMADKADVLAKHRITSTHFIFTVESADEVDSIIRAYQKRMPPKCADIRRLK